MISSSLMLAVFLLFTNVILGGQTASQPTVEMRYCGMRPGKPPLSYTSFDVMMRNPANKPQWFLFPAALYDKAVGPRKGAGVDAVELLSDSPAHKVTVVHLMGTMNLQPEGAGGFKGVLLPAGAAVSIHGFEISFWGELASPIPISVVLADRITIGGTPVEQWFGKPLMSAQTADVKDLQHAGSKMARELKELPVEITKSGEFKIADALANECQAKTP